MKLRDILIPGTTGGFYTLIPGSLGFLIVLVAYLTSYVTCMASAGCVEPVAHPATGELLTASVAMLGVHATRATLADRANAKAGYGPVPVTDNDGTSADPPRPAPQGDDPPPFPADVSRET